MHSLDKHRFQLSPCRGVGWVVAASMLLPLVCGRICAAPLDQKPPIDLAEIGLEKLLKIEIPIVTGASKMPQKATEAPSSITVVGAEDIKRYGYRTLADILQSVRGLHVSYDRTYDSLGFRGFTFGGFGNSNDRVLVLVDGHRINNSLTDGAFIGTEFILDVDLIEQVEVIRGPGSVLYGGNALFGVINVVTRNGRDLTGYGTEVSAEAASYDTYKGRATFGHRFENGLELLLSGTRYDSQGQEQLFFKEYATNSGSNGVARNGDYDNSKSFFGKLIFSDISLEGAFISREKGIPTALTGTVFDEPRTRSVDARSYVNLSYSHEFADVVDVTAQVYYDRQDSQLDLFYDFDLGNGARRRVLARQDQVGEWWGTELQLTKKLFERHTITLGAEYRDDFHQGQRYFVVPAMFGPPVERKRTTLNYGVYLAGDFTLLTNLHLSAGARYDQYAGQDPTANPRIALIYNPVDQSAIKAIYGTAFRAPNFFETIYQSPYQSLGPETITSYELVYEQGFGKQFGASDLRASISGFYNQIEDVLDFRLDPQGGYTVENVSGAIAKGLEMELEGVWANGLRSRASYTLQDTRESGKVLPNSPKHLAKLNLSVPVVSQKLFAGLEVQYTSKRTTIPTVINTAGSSASGFVVANFTLFSTNLVKGLEVSAGVYNLFDQSYGDPATPFHNQDVIARDGRTFRVKLTYRF